MKHFTAWDTVDWSLSDEQISKDTNTDIRTVATKRTIFTRKVTREEVEALLSKGPIFARVKGWDNE